MTSDSASSEEHQIGCYLTLRSDQSDKPPVIMGFPVGSSCFILKHVVFPPPVPALQTLYVVNNLIWINL